MKSASRLAALSLSLASLLFWACAAPDRWSGSTGGEGGGGGEGGNTGSTASGTPGSTSPASASAGSGTGGAGGAGGAGGSTTDGLLLYYAFEELTGPAVADGSPNKNDGTAAGGATFGEPGKVGSAISFDGAGYVNAGVPASFTGLSAVTAEAWVRVDNPGSEYSMGVVSKSAGNGDVDFILAVRKDGALYWASPSTDATYGYRALLSAPAAIPIGAWIHIAGTYDVAKNQRRFFLNGDEVTATGESFGEDSALALKGSGPVRVGNYVWDGASEVGFLHGAVDEVRVFSVVRAPAEICADAGGTYDAASSTCL